MAANQIIPLIKARNKFFRILFPFVGNPFRIFLLRRMGIRVGKDVVITSHTKITCKFGYESLLTIEDRAAIGADHIILTSDPCRSLLLSMKGRYPFLEVVGRVIIKHDSWIGAGSIILPNVIIGEYSIVAAGSVVTRNVAPYTVVAGVPAKPIRKMDSPN
jgi:acetyltransferase-like isoleucine patch superfamily enzyme